MNAYTNKSVARLGAHLVEPMINMIERELEVERSPAERAGKIELLADLKARRIELDFRARQMLMFEVEYQLEQSR